MNIIAVKVSLESPSRQRSANLLSGITEKMFRFAEGVANGFSVARPKYRQWSQKALHAHAANLSAEQKHFASR